MRKSLIIFDMDGTLVDSSLLLANAINHVRGHLGLDPLPIDAIIGYVNDHRINPAQYFYEAEHFEPIHEQLFSGYYSQNHHTQLRLYEGILPLLEWLRSSQVRIALATNAHRISTLESLRHLQIESCFDAVVCHDDVPRAKPSPDMLFRAIEMTETSVAESLFIGDGPRDEEAAHAAGIDYRMVDWGFTEHDKGKKVIKSIEALREELERVLQERSV